MPRCVFPTAGLCGIFWCSVVCGIYRASADLLCLRRSPSYSSSGVLSADSVLASSWFSLALDLGFWLGARLVSGGSAVISVRILQPAVFSFRCIVVAFIFGGDCGRQLFDRRRITENWNLLGEALINVLFPLLLVKTLGSRSEFTYSYRLFMRILFYLMCVICVATMLLSRPLLALLFGEEYLPAAEAINIYIWGLPWLVSTQILAYCVAKEGHLAQIAAVMLSSVLLNCVLNVYVIPYYGMIGAAVVFALSIPMSLVLCLCCTKYGREQLGHFAVSLLFMPLRRR